MTTTPNTHPADGQPAAMPRICRPLFNAIVDAVLPLPYAPMKLSVNLARDDPDTAKLLCNHLEAKGESVGRLTRRVLNVLRPMVARLEAQRVLDEFENIEGEK
jgi:hypothetical protein